MSVRRDCGVDDMQHWVVNVASLSSRVGLSEEVRAGSKAWCDCTDAGHKRS